jgi:hypothetical protein
VGESIAVEWLDGDSLSVQADLACVNCGYNLRTLSAGGLCPECAAPVIDSLRRSNLNVADAGWLRRVGRGLGWLAIIQMFWLGLHAVWPVSALLSTPPPAGYIKCHLLLGPVVAVIWAWGIVRATVGEPLCGRARRRDRAARVAVVGIAVYAGVCVAYTGYAIGHVLWIFGFRQFWEQFGGPNSTPFAGSQIHSFAITMVFLWSASASGIGLCLVLRRLARRAGRINVRRLLGLLLAATIVAALFRTVEWIWLSFGPMRFSAFRFYMCSEFVFLAMEVLTLVVLVRSRGVVLGACSGRVIQAMDDTSRLGAAPA